MPRCVCAVFDRNIDYINRFSGYLKKKNNLPFEFCYFTEREALEAFLEKSGADLLLLSETEETSGISDASGISGSVEGEGPSGVFGRSGGSLNEEEHILKKSLDEAFIAELGKKSRIALLKEPEGSGSVYPVINKYQSMEGIISVIAELLDSREDLADTAGNAVSGMEIIGIYSFGHLSKAVNFALGFLLGCPGQKRALYINLERFSGLSARFEEMPSQTLSDVIYYFMTGSGRLRACVYKAKGRIGFADVFTAPDDLEDLDTLEDGNWPAFLRSLARILETDRIIIDLGEGFRNLIKAFDLCAKVYLIVSAAEDGTRLDELRGYLEGAHRPDLFSKIMEVDTDRI